MRLLGTRSTWSPLAVLFAVAAILVGSEGVAAASLVHASSGATFLSTLAKPKQLASTVPANGDVNPYGVAVVQCTVGELIKGDTLVSNFNDKVNVQGTGTTIMEVTPSGTATTFANIGSLPVSDSCPGGVGLTTALSILPGGWVVVGSLPTGTGGALPSVNPAGCLIVLEQRRSSGRDVVQRGHQRSVGHDRRDDDSGADLFVSNSLSRPSGLDKTPPVGVCTVVRIGVSLTPGQMPR